jgi:two-component system OmpR family response regulator
MTELDSTKAAKVSMRNILLVDDDKFLLDMYTMKFATEGYTAHGCISVSEGLSLLQKGFAADAIVFDLIMPEKDGFALLQSLHDMKLVPNAVKIALTNQSDESDQNHAKALGADACYVKATMIPSEVVNMVSAEIAKRKSG